MDKREINIPFNRAVYMPNTLEYVNEVLGSRKVAGNGKFTKLCAVWMEQRFGARKILLTTSGTAALEMAATLLDISPGDEIIMPSYTFVSTANAFVLRGATPVFIDIRPDTMNMDETLIEASITPKTRAIVVVHYAGVACEMDKIMKISRSYNIPVVEDAAQGVMAAYHNDFLGTIGDLGCYSFHETKNYSMGEGGALLINDDKFLERAEIIWEKGTNRSRYYQGLVDKYTWVDMGSSYLPSEINSAYLYSQLEMADEINENRLKIWNKYNQAFKSSEAFGDFEIPRVPDGCIHNGHMFYIKAADMAERTKWIDFGRLMGIGVVFHYVPLHSSEAGKRYGRFYGKDRFTTTESERILRLPLFYGLKEEEQEYIITIIKKCCTITSSLR